MTGDRVATSLLLALLDGATFANAMRRSGKPCRVRLPDDPDARSALVAAHLCGAPATLTFHADGHEPWRERVDTVVLAALSPGGDERCRWVGIDVDATDHGERGLVDPVHAMRTIAECAAEAGLTAGLLVARSRRGRGRHVFLIPPEPVSLADAVIGVAALAAAAFKVAASDVTEYDARHAFRRANGAIARPGEAGAVELLPRSTVKPPHGWALVLPGAGAFSARGGGVIVDPFEDQPIHHECVPRCDCKSWSRFVDEARATLSKRNATAAPQLGKRLAICTDQPRPAIDRIDARTRAFLDGCIPQGARNMSAFAASANLLGCGIDPREAERLIMAGAAACGLPQREALDAFSSAVSVLTRKRGHG
ncbi:MAG: hypothetical protein AABZ12_08225 [Planctomycetota bacterium]